MAIAKKNTTVKKQNENDVLVDDSVTDVIEYNEPLPTKQMKTEKTKKDTWEIKDRTYYLKGNIVPLTFTLNSKHSLRYPLLWFDKETGEQKELRYATNQNSPLVEDQKGQVTLGHIIFREGVLTVPKEKQNLQKLLSIYHPALNKKYVEFNPIADAEDELERFEVEAEALQMALQIDIDKAEAILRVQIGSAVSKMSSKEIRRDLILMAKKDPYLFIDLANDENVELRNVAIVAAESRIIVLSQDQRTFTWGENGRKLMTVPFDENPYSAMAAFFKTDEGIEVYRSIQKRLK